MTRPLLLLAALGGAVTAPPALVVLAALPASAAASPLGAEPTAASRSAPELASGPTVVLEDGVVRVADLMDVLGAETLGGLAALTPEARERVGGLVAARVPAGGELSLSRPAAAALLRRRVPGLTVPDTAASGLAVPGLAASRLAASGLTASSRGPATALPVLATFRRTETALPAEAGSGAGPCWVLTRPVHTGAAVSARDVTEAPCADAGRADAGGADGEDVLARTDGLARTGSAPLRYDRRHGALRANADLRAGTYLGRLALPEEADAEAGSLVTVRVAVGPVVVERQVETVQPARPGGRVFVRDEEGDVFPVSLVEAAGRVGGQRGSRAGSQAHRQASDQADERGTER